MGDDRPEPRRTARFTGSSVLTPPTGVPVVPNAAESRVEPPRSADAVPCVGPVQACISPDSDVVAGSCLCGHGSLSHEHWRRGSDCGVCGAVSCPVFRGPDGRMRRILKRLRLVR
jgi:hypothetical protein